MPIGPGFALKLLLKLKESAVAPGPLSLLSRLETAVPSFMPNTFIADLVKSKEASSFVNLETSPSNVDEISGTNSLIEFTFLAKTQKTPGRICFIEATSTKLINTYYGGKSSGMAKVAILKDAFLRKKW